MSIGFWIETQREHEIKVLMSKLYLRKTSRLCIYGASTDLTVMAHGLLISLQKLPKIIIIDSFVPNENIVFYLRVCNISSQSHKK